MLNIALSQAVSIAHTKRNGVIAVVEVDPLTERFTYDIVADERYADVLASLDVFNGCSARLETVARLLALQ